MNKKISDLIAEFLKFNEIEYVFGIIGSTNSHIFELGNRKLVAGQEDLIFQVAESIKIKK